MRSSLLVLFAFSIVGCLGPEPEVLIEADPAHPADPDPLVETTSTADLTLDADTLVFTDSAIGELLGTEYLALGFDPEAETCVLFVYSLQLSPAPSGAHCDDAFVRQASVFLLPSAAPCSVDELYYQWPHHSVLAGEGCVEFADFHAGAYDLLDVTYKVQSTLGDEGPLTIQADNRASYDPPLTTIGFEIESPEPTDVYVSWGLSGYGQHVPNAAHVYYDDIFEVPDFFDQCHMGFCGEGAPEPCQSFTQRGINVSDYDDDRRSARFFMNWDGRFRFGTGPDPFCYERELVTEDELTASLCFGFERDAELRVLGAGCHELPFTRGAERVTLKLYGPANVGFGDEDG